MSETAVEAIPGKAYEAIAREISSEESPVGIDAKHTHVLILHRLGRLEERLGSIEARLDAVGEGR